MAIVADLATFRAAFPEFDGTPDVAIELKLAEAATTHKPPVWHDPDIRAQGILYKAADLLTYRGGAQSLRLDEQDGVKQSLYDKRWMELARSVSYGFRVT